MAVVNYAQIGGDNYDFADGANLAPLFSTSKAYAAGEFVTYTDGYVYEFTTAHAAGAWNTAHVSKVTIGENLTQLKSALESIGLTIVDGVMYIQPVESIA